MTASSRKWAGERPANGFRMEGLGYRLWFHWRDGLVDALKAVVPARSRTYAPEERTWWISAPEWPKALRVLRAHGLFLANWYATASSSEDDPGQGRFRWEPPGEPPPRRPSTERLRSVDPYAELHLLPTAPPEVVRAAYRALALLHHPDKGGSEAAMKRINAAYERIAP